MMTRPMQRMLLAALSTLVIATACNTEKSAQSRAHGDDHVREHGRLWAGVDRAVAVLAPTAGNATRGKVTFHQVEDGVRVVGEISGLNPGQKHAMHVHEFGDISAADGTAAGGHYNPEGHEHGLPNANTRHAGDLGNLEANDAGVATIDQTFDNITIAGTMNPIIGRGLIVHAEPDDGGQPVGNAGARIAQAVIGVAERE